MKAMKILMTMILVAGFMMSNGSARSSKSSAKRMEIPETKMSKTTATTNTYLVTAPHTKEQCMAVMDDMKSKGDAYLSKFKFGCMSGDHTSYAFLEAASEDAARKMLPKDVQANAKIEKVDVFTAKKIEDLHNGM